MGPIFDFMATMNISLPDEMKAHVEAQVETGRFANSSDYIRDLIRRDQERRDELVALLLEAERSGYSDQTFDEIVESARERARSRAS
jgi:antitoxin ParD1/3/4